MNSYKAKGIRVISSFVVTSVLVNLKRVHNRDIHFVYLFTVFFVSDKQLHARFEKVKVFKALNEYIR